MARIPAFQAGCVGSIPITRSKKDDYVVIVFLVIFALRRVLLLRSDIRLSAEWYCLAAVKEANRISLRRSRNITFAKAKISRRTKWGISLSIPIAFAVGYFYVKKGGWEPQVYKSEVCGANERRAKLGSTRATSSRTLYRSWRLFYWKSHPSLTPLFLLSETGHAQVACSVVNALTTALFRYHSVSGYYYFFRHIFASAVFCWYIKVFQIFLEFRQPYEFLCFTLKYTRKCKR